MTLIELRFEVEICDTIKCVITIDLSLMTLKKKIKNKTFKYVTDRDQHKCSFFVRYA